MSEYLYAIALIGFLLWVGRSAIFWGLTLQKYTFSFSRLRHFLLHTVPGRKILFSPVSIIKWLAILVYPIIIFQENYQWYYHFSIALLYIWEGAVVLKEAEKWYKFRLHFLHLKTLLVILCTTTLCIALIIFTPLDRFLWLLVVDRILVFLMIVLLLITALPEEFYWEFQSIRIAEKLRRRPRLTQVLVAGGTEAGVVSYILREILQKKQQVLTMPEGLPERELFSGILNKLKPEHTYLLYSTEDMGASLKKILLTNRPQYVVISNPISAEKLREIIMDMNASGAETTYIVNADAVLGKMLLGKKRKNVLFYSMSEKKDTIVQMKGILEQPDSTSFTLEIRGVAETISTSLITQLSCIVLLPVISVLAAAGYSNESIRDEVGSARMPDTYLHYEKQRGITIMSDIGEIEGLRLLAWKSYLLLFSERKMLVLDGDLLTALSKESLRELTSFITNSFAYVFVTETPVEQRFRSELLRQKKKIIFATGSTKVITEYIVSLKKKNDVILLYGPGTVTIANTIREKKRKKL